MNSYVLTPHVSRAEPPFWRAAFVLCLVTACSGTVTGNDGRPDGNGGGASSSSDDDGDNGEDGQPAPLPGVADPGRVTLHRLNRFEYNNTVRDLLGTTLRPADRFTDDRPDFGFDNNADLLSLSAVQMELYQQAASTLVQEAFQKPASKQQLIGCNPTQAACVRDALQAFGTRAYRRPLATKELDGFVKLVEKATGLGASADEAFATAVEAMLLSPHFLFRVELDDPADGGDARALRPYELASRLSYLVYSSMPDAPLMQAAKDGLLVNEREVQAQLDRMLADPKAQAFAAHFSGGWLGVATIERREPDKNMFPRFSQALASSMRREVELFFVHALEGNRPAKELLTAQHSFLDAALAKHYGVPEPTQAWKEVAMATSNRGGLLMMAGPLTVTSQPTRTSVVKRGAWILSDMLCDEPPPPPPDVPNLPEDPAAGGSQRERLEAHRKNPACASCHAVMDGLGFALENFDAIGAHRTIEEGKPIDVHGTLEDGTSFTGGRELAQVVAQDPRFAHCLAEKMLGYALGRAVTDGDEPYIEEILSRTEKSQHAVKDMLSAVVSSDPFQKRRAEREKETTAP